MILDPLHEMKISADILSAGSKISALADKLNVTMLSIDFSSDDPQQVDLRQKYFDFFDSFIEYCEMTKRLMQSYAHVKSFPNKS